MLINSYYKYKIVTENLKHLAFEITNASPTLIKSSELLIKIEP
jgi:hypothetical protein